MQNTENLYEPSLDSDWEETKSFDIGKLFFVAFFGGAIPLMVLASKNMKWLNIPKKIIYSLIAVGSLIIISKFMLASLLLQGSIDLTSSKINLGYKIGCVLLFLIYSAILKKPYQQHLLNNRPTLPILTPAIIWSGIGIFIEMILMSLIIAI